MTRKSPKRAPRKRKKKTRKRLSRAALKFQLFKVAIGFLLLIALVGAAGWLTQYLMQDRQRAIRADFTQKRQIKSAASARPKIKKPLYEVPQAPQNTVSAPVDAPRTTPPARDGLPRVAIIIDDVGYDPKIVDKLFKLEVAVTLSVLPNSPHGKTIAHKARRRGTEIMIHLPMEPVEYPDVDPGPGALLSSMGPDELIGQLKRHLDAIPVAIGVNNHMGSKLTASSDQMNQIFTILRKRNLFFIDSLTTDQTQTRASARLLKVPYARRSVFLDNDPYPDGIRRQIEQLIRIAGRNESAVGICHPYATTLDVLRQELPELKKRVKLVPASAVVRILG